MRPLWFLIVILSLVALLTQTPGLVLAASPLFPTDNPNPPAAPVKLIFIHHSTGGNWLGRPQQRSTLRRAGARLDGP